MFTLEMFYSTKYFHRENKGIFISSCCKIILDCKFTWTYTVDRPTKHSLSKLTNLSSKWKVGWFCRQKIQFFAFRFILIIEFKFVHEDCIIRKSKTKEDISTEIFPPLLQKQTDTHIQGQKPKKVSKRFQF